MSPKVVPKDLHCFTTKLNSSNFGLFNCDFLLFLFFFSFFFYSFSSSILLFLLLFFFFFTIGHLPYLGHTLLFLSFSRTKKAYMRRRKKTKEGRSSQEWLLLPARASWNNPFFDNHEVTSESFSRLINKFRAYSSS